MRTTSEDTQRAYNLIDGGVQSVDVSLIGFIQEQPHFLRVRRRSQRKSIKAAKTRTLI